jgi:transcriptional regulator with XRE-family HTH domain
MDTKARPKAMDPDELRDALAKSGFGQTEFARLIGCTAGAIRNYLQGTRPILGGTALALRLLADDPELKEKALRLSEMKQEDLTPPRKRLAKAEDQPQQEGA